MDITPLIPEGRQIIQSYGPAGFKVSGQRYETGIAVTPENTDIWTKKQLNDLSIDDFMSILEKADSYDVCLLGTGAVSVFPESSLLKELKSKGLKPDIMDSGAACRTYNVLMAEGRRVIALLLPL